MTHFPVIVVLNKNATPQTKLEETIIVDEKSKAMYEGLNEAAKAKGQKPQEPPLQYIESVNLEPNLEEWLAELLAPFDENTNVEPYRDESENYMDEYKSFLAEIKKGEGWVIRTANKLVTDAIKEESESPLSHKSIATIHEEHDKQTKEYQEIIDKVEANDFSFDDWVKWYHGDDAKYDPKDYQVLSTYNPDSKWDWFQIGGRWRDWIKDKSGQPKNIMRVGELGLEIMEHEEMASQKGKHEIMRKIMMKEVSEEEAEKLQFEELGMWTDWAEPINPVYEERPRKHAKCKNCDHKPNEFKMGGGAKCEDGKCDFSHDLYQHLVSCDGIESFEDYYERLHVGFTTNVLVYWDHENNRSIWMERGRFGYWGIHEKKEDITEKQWYEMFHKKLKSFDSETPMVLVDCHI